MPDPVQGQQTETLLTDDKPQSGGDEAAKAAADKAAADKAAADAANQTPEQKAAAEKKAVDDKAAADAAAEKQGAPEKYEAFVAPEGVTIDETTTGEFGALAKELNLSQESAQKVYDLGAKMTQKASDKFKADIVAQVKKWGDESKADKEIGEAFDENLGVAKLGLEKTGTPELKKLLKESGLGNHPEFLRHFLRLGKQFKNDKTVTGADSKAPATAQGFYMNSKMNP